jgi:hypothetical protein
MTWRDQRSHAFSTILHALIPNIFTQLMGEAIDESPHPPLNTNAPTVNVGTEQSNTDTGPYVATSNTTKSQDTYTHEASSQQRDSHVGMRYDT